MAPENASKWKESEHLSEKKDVLGKMQEKLEGKNRAKELPDLIIDLAKFRYPQDPDATKLQAKKESFKTALDEVSSICKSDTSLKQYDIKKTDILEWCRIPMLDSKVDTWETMTQRSNYSMEKAINTDPNKIAENTLALSTVFSKIGLSKDLMPECTMQVRKRDPDSFAEKLSGLPKLEPGKTGYEAFLVFNIGRSNIKVTFDPTNPSAVFIDALVDIPKENKSYVAGGLGTMGPDFKFTKFEGRKNVWLSPGGSLSDYLSLIKLANKEA